MVGGGNNDINNTAQSSEKIQLELHIGVFFDGTLNSKANIDERKDFESFLAEHPESLAVVELDKLYKEDSIKDAIKKDRSLGYSKSKQLLKAYDNEKKSVQEYLKTNPTGIRNALYGSNDSYTNEYTNVVRFYNCFKNEFEADKNNPEKICVPIYIEGIGAKPRKLKTDEDSNNLEHNDNKIDFTTSPTNDVVNDSYDNYENGKSSLDEFIEDNGGFISCSDDELGSALGIGLFGVKKKVEAACEKINCLIAEYVDKENTEVKMHLYVFGFSRGSAAARCFSSFLKKRIGKTIVEKSVNTRVMGWRAHIDIGKKLEKENEYKTSLMTDWLDKLSDKRISFSPSPKVKFLGLYDTVSSYGADFMDDVDELSLKIDPKNVDNVFQICAGDEYRVNFMLTDISSAGGEDKYIIIPGAHSDVGGGYAHGSKEQLNCYWNYTRGLKGKKRLHEEGWFNEGESERTISNLYSVIPFLLMKDKIVGREEVFDGDTLMDYRLPPPDGLEIDGIKHEYSEDLCNFYNKLREGAYIYAIEKTGFLFFKRKTINLLSEEEILLKKIRHDFLHLSAKRECFKDLFVYNSDKGNKRTVIPG